MNTVKKTDILDFAACTAEESFHRYVDGVELALDSSTWKKVDVRVRWDEKLSVYDSFSEMEKTKVFSVEKRVVSQGRSGLTVTLVLGGREKYSALAVALAAGEARSRVTGQRRGLLAARARHRAAIARVPWIGHGEQTLAAASFAASSASMVPPHIALRAATFLGVFAAGAAVVGLCQRPDATALRALAVDGLNLVDECDASDREVVEAELCKVHEAS